jgi:ABC-2 type transport system ATP-binding protein
MNVEIIDLVKNYGKFQALNQVSLTIGRGMFGLLGPNGAGKTTLMRVITTLLPITTGKVIIGGVDAMRDPAFVRRNLGYIPQDFGFYKNLNAYELLDYIGTMKGIPRPERQRQVLTLLEQVNLIKDAKRRVGGYSGGMKQRLGIAQALLGDPPLIVVDEPTAGLDPEERIRFRNLLTRLSGERTVLLSTHIVGDIEASCSALAILNRGKVIFSGPPDALIQQATGRVWQVEIDPHDYERVEHNYRVTSSRTVNGRLQVRVIASDSPLGQGVVVAPELEEGYMAVMFGAEKSEVRNA